MPNLEVQALGLKEFQKALDRNPELVKKELADFFSRATARLKSGLWNNPWRIGGSGGGIPVLTGNLRDTHATEIKDFQARIYPTSDYAKFVHGGTSKMEARPWLDFIQKEKAPEIKELAKKMLENITKDLAK